MKSRTVTMSLDSHYIHQRPSSSKLHYLRLRGNVNKDLAGTAFGLGVYVKPHKPALDPKSRRHYIAVEVVEKTWDDDVGPDGVKKVADASNGRFEITLTPVHYISFKFLKQPTIKVPVTFVHPGLFWVWLDDEVLKRLHYKELNRLLYDVLSRMPKLPPPMLVDQV